jgi:hypothetical protein
MMQYCTQRKSVQRRTILMGHIGISKREKDADESSVFGE